MERSESQLADDKDRRKYFYMVGIGVLLGLGIGAILLATVGLIGNKSVELTTNNNEGSALVPAIGSPAPDFELSELEGGTIKLSDLRDKVVVINFWATWCGPCAYEMPYFQKFYARNASKFELLAVNNQETVEQITPFVSELKLTYPILLDKDAEVTRLYQVIGFPTTIFIDHSGIIKFLHVGVMTEEEFVEYMNKMGVSG